MSADLTDGVGTRYAGHQSMTQKVGWHTHHEAFVETEDW